LSITDASFAGFATSAMTAYVEANTSSLGGTSFGRIYNIGSAGNNRIFMATQSSSGATPRLLVQRPAGGTEWYTTPSGDVPDGECVLTTDKTATADMNAMRSWINSISTALTWGPSRAIGAMDGALLIGGPSSDTATGFIFREFILCNSQHTGGVRNGATSSIGSIFGATII
jgi:hypothetical protein